MALYDPAQGRIIVRIVYDGLAGAGKTTNLRQLCRFFTPVRRGEMITPEEREGRTIFFDWLQLEGGIVAGHQLRCELVTVPGQIELSRRREAILATADGVVFVCDASEAALAETRSRLSFVRSRTRGDLDVPVVIQANKQDAPGAISPQELAAVLDARDLPIVAARANDGHGVREAAVTAIRAVADRLQPYVIKHGTNGLVGVAAKPEDLYQQLLADTIDPQPRPVSETPKVATEPPQEAACEPPFPNASATTGMVWPAVSGRDTLRRATAEQMVLRSDLSGRNDGENGSGKSDGFFYQAGPWCLKTSLRRRFADTDEARAALLRLARRKLALDELLLEGTALTVATGSDGAHWLWTIAPWVTTLRSELATADTACDQEALAGALRAFADAGVKSLYVLLTRGLALDVHPSNFARMPDGRISYLDDDAEHASQLLALGHSLLRRMDEYCRFENAIDAYLTHLADRLVSTFDRNDLDRMGVADSIAAARPTTTAGQAGRAILLDILGKRPNKARSS